MTLRFDILTDWDDDGFICRYATPADPVNRFGATALEVSNMYYRVTGGGSLTPIIDETDYGLESLTWVTATGATADIGYNGTNWNSPLMSAGTYTLVFWIKSASVTHDAVSLLVRFMSGSGTIVATSSSFQVLFANGWTKVAITATAAGGTRYYLQIARLGAAAATYSLTGPMLVAGSIAPEFNIGGTSIYDNLRHYANDASWTVGFNQPYQYVAAVGRLRLTLKNTTRIFSPEYSGSPLYGKLRGQRKFQVYGVSPGEDRLMWTGWLDRISPQPGVLGTRLAYLEASDGRKYLDGKKLYTDPQTNKTARELIYQQIMPLIELPQTTPFVPTIPPPFDYETVYPYALDNAEDGTDALRVLREIVGAEQGKFYFVRGGSYGWLDLRALGGSTASLDADLVDDFANCDYRYAETLINECVATAQKRKLSASLTKKLWELEETLTLDALESEEIRVQYTNEDTDNDRQIAGIGVYVVFTGDAGVSYVLNETNANTATITLTNANGAPANVTGLEVRGQKLTSFNQVQRQRRDDVSIAEFGVRAERLDFKIISDKKQAKNLANYRIGRFGQPFGEITSLTLKPNTTAMQDLIVKIDPGSRIRVRETQLAHDGYYNVIGEEHRLGNDDNSVVSKWYLEPIDRALTIGDNITGVIGNTNYIGLY